MTRQEALELLNKFEFSCDFDECTNDWECDECVDALNMAIEALEQEPKQGKWIEHEWAEIREGLLISNYECSNCHMWERIDSDYCPNCGSYNGE